MFEEKKLYSSKGFDILSDYERSWFFCGHINFIGQLDAINSLLKNNSQEYQKLKKRIDDADSRDDLAELIEKSIYISSAHSMAAVGMLAPFTESLFCTFFKNVGEYYNNYNLCLPVGDRSKLKNNIWNCKYFLNQGGEQKAGIAKGISQLADYLEMTSSWPDPDSLKIRLEALFSFRNSMFHNGIEWPDNELKEFKQKIDNWPPYLFEKATKEEEPYFYFMSERFISECLLDIDPILESIGKVSRKLYEQRT